MSKKVLLIFDGGLAPGYTPVAVSLVEEAEKYNWETHIARSGFRSLCEGISDEPQIVRAVSHPLEAFELNSKGIVTECLGRRFFRSGSDFRSERFPEFKETSNQKIAAQEIIDNKFDIVIACGGNGSLMGIKKLSQFLPDNIQTGFVNISADSDVSGDSSVGFLSCAEHGAKIARGLYEDAYTHRRVYILEMMGNDSGRHSLHAGSAARAHLIILPSFEFTSDILQEIADTIQTRRHALIIVAEGYKKQYRKDNNIKLTASEFFAQELAEYGLVNTKNKRVIAEPYSRFLRGTSPLFIDGQVARLKCQMLIKALSKGSTRAMPYYLSGHNLGIEDIDNVYSDNTIEKAFASMINRLELPLFSQYVEDILA